MKTNPPHPTQISQSKLPTFSFYHLLLKFHAFTTFAKEGITYLSGQDHFLSCMQILQCQVKQITTPQRLNEVINPIKTITLYKKDTKKTLTFCFLGSTLTSFSAASTVVFTFLFLTKTRTSGTETSLGPDIHEQSIKRVSLKTKKDSILIRSTEIRTFGEFKVLVLSDLGLCLKWKSLFWIGGI
jgi:hypothetical protein